MLLIREVPGKGRGVFAQQTIPVGTVIEKAPVLVIPRAEWEFVERTVFNDYCYSWGPDLQDAAFGLGYVSLYNHSYSPNAQYIKRMEERMLWIVALREIHEGDEVTVNYNSSPNDQSPLWFEVRE